MRRRLDRQCMDEANITNNYLAWCKGSQEERWCCCCWQRWPSGVSLQRKTQLHCSVLVNSALCFALMCRVAGASLAQPGNPAPRLRIYTAQSQQLFIDKLLWPSIEELGAFHLIHMGEATDIYTRRDLDYIRAWPGCR